VITHCPKCAQSSPDCRVDQTEESSEQLNRHRLPSSWSSTRVARLGLKFSQRRDIQYITADYSGSAAFDLTDNWRSTSSVGAQLYRRRTDLVWAQGDQFPAPDLETVAAAAVRSGFDDYVENTTVGVFVQQQMAFKDRLFLTGAARVDNNTSATT
jgi:hypothetical protein